MKTLILNTLPPSTTKWPSSSMSILKGYLHYHGYPSHIHYWNIALEKELLKFFKINDGNTLNEDYSYVLPFINYINVKKDDPKLIRRFIAEYSSFNSHLINSEKNFFDKHIKESAVRLEEVIMKELEKIDIKNCLLFGVASKLFQLIPANVISEIVKKVSPATKVVIGGIGTKDEAVAIMKNFPHYDYAVWGEGEYPLLQLYKSLLKEKEEITEIPHLVYRTDTDIEISTAKHQFLDLNGEIKAEYEDFFKQTDLENKNCSMPIEGSRGCHWSKCKFCFLNDGYRYRVKNNENKLNEIKTLIKLHGVKKFLFMDNDIIGKNIDDYELFLNELIELKEEYPDFEIPLAEIISKGLNSRIIKKMSLAGFISVQIGYESPSNELLKKINKKNSFASNLLFIKWASYYSIKIGGANVLRGLLEETEDDIYESIENLRFLRFFLKRDNFEHNLSHLAIGKTSRYFKEVEEKGELNQWNENIFSGILPEDYISPEDRFVLFYYGSGKIDKLWAFFEKIQNHYLSNEYIYSMIRSEDKIIFQEFFNKKKMDEIEFQESSIHWSILKSANYRVVSLYDLLTELQTKHPDITEATLRNAIKELRDSFLLYTDYDYTEMVSLLNTDLVLN